MEEPRGQRVVHPPLVRAGLAALAVPAVLGLLAVPGLLLEAPPWPAVVLMFVGSPLVPLAGEDGLAVGLAVTAAVWAPIVGAVWWTVGRRIASDTMKAPAGFTWEGWARKFTRLAPLVLIVQTMGAMLFVGVLMTTATNTPTAVAVGAVVSAVAIVMLLRRYAPTSSSSRQQPSAADAYGQQKQCPRCGEFIELGSTECEWCDERLARKWHRSMP